MHCALIKQALQSTTNEKRKYKIYPLAQSPSLTASPIHPFNKQVRQLETQIK